MEGDPVYRRQRVFPADQRIGPIEMQTYKVPARLISYKLEEDGDFHIAVADVEDPGKAMIAEIPSPDCAGACYSAHVEEFRRAGAAIIEFSNHAPVELLSVRPVLGPISEHSLEMSNIQQIFDA